MLRRAPPCILYLRKRPTSGMRGVLLETEQEMPPTRNHKLNTLLNIDNALGDIACVLLVLCAACPWLLKKKKKQLSCCIVALRLILKSPSRQSSARRSGKYSWKSRKANSYIPKAFSSFITNDSHISNKVSSCLVSFQPIRLSLPAQLVLRRPWAFPVSWLCYSCSVTVGEQPYKTCFLSQSSFYNRMVILSTGRPFSGSCYL